MFATVESVSMTKSEPFSGKKEVNLINLTVCSEDEKNKDESEKEITYGEYVDKINRRALEEQKKIMQAKMKGQLKKDEREAEWLGSRFKNAALILFIPNILY